jgi:hypothetical protein
MINITRMSKVRVDYELMKESEYILVWIDDITVWIVSIKGENSTLNAHGHLTMGLLTTKFPLS